MHVEFDGQEFDAFTVGVAIDRDYELDKWGRPWLEKQTWDLNIRIKNPDPASESALDTAIENMEDVFSGMVSDHVRIKHTGVAKNNTAHVIESGDHLGGVRLVKGPSYAKYQAGELASFRTARVRLEAYLPKYSSDLRIIDADEKISGRQGVGPAYAVLQPNTGRASIQQVRTHQHVNLTQTGFVTYAGKYGNIPGPVMTAGQLAHPEPVVSHPRIIGGGNGVASAYVSFRIDYTYLFAANTNVLVLPTKFYP